jgi:hypothetical protein
MDSYEEIKMNERLSAPSEEEKYHQTPASESLIEIED